MDPLDDEVPCFEVQVMLYFTTDGKEWIDISILGPDGEEIRPPEHEVLGVLDLAKNMTTDLYKEEREE